MKWLQTLLPKKLTKQHYLLIVILLLAAFLRLYNIPNTVQFLGDQGRDAIIVSRIFRELDPVFIGPVTSVGNMYLGPLYYYFMLPFLFLTYPSPMGPVYAVALLGIFTVFLMYYLGQKLIGKQAALWATGLFGLSAVVAHNTRFSWNPNPAPFVSLFMLYFTYKAVKKSEWYWVGVTACFAVLIQLHYLTLLSGAGFGLVWLFQLIQKLRNKKPIKKMILSTSLAALIFIASLTPLILFDFRHDGLNRKAFLSILTKEDAFSQEVSDDRSSILKFSSDFLDRSELIIADISVGRHSMNLNVFISLAVITAFIWYLREAKKQKKDLTGDLILASFLLTGILGTAAYKHAIYEHYIAYLFPVTFLVLGRVIQFLLTKKIPGIVAVLLFLIVFARFNYRHAQVILNSLGWTIAHIQGVAKTIEDRVTPGEKYNIVLLNDTGDINGQNYRYFLLTSDKPPVPEEKFGEVDTLFIIDEQRKVEKEVDSPVYEIVTFPNKEPAEEYQIQNGPEITVLRKDTN